MKPSKRYPGIAKAALEISYDNGGINRDRSEARMMRELSGFLEAWPQGSAHLVPINAWLAALSEDDLMTVCAGEQTDQMKVLEGAPVFTDTLLNEIFEQVG